MNREILFKAKTTKKDNPKHEFSEKWVEGNSILCKGKAYIHPMSNKVGITGEIGRMIVLHEVIPDTLCQYTGGRDKYHTKIWENDICKVNTQNIDEEDGYFVVQWDAETLRFVLTGNGLVFDFDDLRMEQVEVVGNIFDNPELLEVE